MKKNHLFIVYYLLARVLIYFFTNKILRNFDFQQFIIEYRRYIIISTLSYIFYCVTLYDEEKIFRRNLVKRGNIYLFIFLFIRPLFNIPPFSFLLLSGIIRGLRKIRGLNKKIKIPLFIVGGISILGIFLSGFFYLYPEAPDIQGFIAKQSPKLIISSTSTIPKNESYIQIQNLDNQKKETFTFKPEKRKINLTENSEILYASNTPREENQIFLLLENGDLMNIFPQTLVHFDKDHQTITILQGTWEIAYSSLERKWDFSGNLQELNEKTYQTITDSYRNDLNIHLYKQIGNGVQKNVIIRNINKKFLTIMEKILPGVFYQNLQNFEEFNKYRKTDDTILDTSKYQNTNHQAQEWLFSEGRDHIKQNKESRTFSNNF